MFVRDGKFLQFPPDLVIADRSLQAVCRIFNALFQH